MKKSNTAKQRRKSQQPVVKNERNNNGSTAVNINSNTKKSSIKRLKDIPYYTIIGGFAGIATIIFGFLQWYKSPANFEFKDVNYQFHHLVSVFSDTPEPINPNETAVLFYGLAYNSGDKKLLPHKFTASLIFGENHITFKQLNINDFGNVFFHPNAEKVDTLNQYLLNLQNVEEISPSETIKSHLFFNIPLSLDSLQKIADKSNAIIEITCTDVYNKKTTENIPFNMHKLTTVKSEKYGIDEIPTQKYIDGLKQKN